MNKTWINVAVKKETHKKLMLFKIKCEAKNLNEVISQAIKLLKEHLKK